jgi:hypothetical protein
MRILIFHGYLLRGTGSNIYNANLARALAGLGHEVDLFICQDRTAQAPKGVRIHVPEIGRVLPVYVGDHYEGFDALPFPELDERALGRYLDVNIAAVRSVPPPDIALVGSISSLWLLNEPKIETEQEEDEMDDRADTADLRCFDKIRPQQRHRNIGEIEIEQDAR